MRRITRSGTGGRMMAVVLAGFLTGCSPTAPSAGPAAAPGTSAATAPAATPSAVPTFDPAATAEEAIEVFDSVNAATLAADPAADGPAFLDGLAAAGFDKAAMEVTSDTTTIGSAADSISFSVRWGESCLVGQNGSAVGGYHSAVTPVLGTGTCLVGSTRPIDW